jgi:hypothetical protein
VAWKYRVLVVAHVTADSDELLEAMSARAERDPTSFTLLVPARGAGRAARRSAEQTLADALDRLRAPGLEVEGHVGDNDPVIAVREAWDPGEFDELIVSTLPTGSSKWLQADLPHRVERITGVPVMHVVASPPKPPARGSPPAKREPSGLLAPLRVLGWGRSRRTERPR